MKNKKITSLITGYGYDGEGVCRVEGKVTFLPFVIEGEEVEFYLEQETSSFCKGKLSKVLSQSPLRRTPPCVYFGRCGGCAYQHMDYENEIKIKKNLFSSHLKKIGYNGEIKVFPSSQRYGYRNKIKLFVQDEKIGLKYRASDKVIDINGCRLASNKINEIILNVKNFIIGQNLFDVFSEIVIREDDGQVLVNFYKKIDKKVDFQGLFLLLGRKSGIFETYKGFTSHVLGIEEIEIEEGGLKCSFKPTSFHQVNNYIMPKLYENVLNECQGESVLNCYSGAGVLSGILLSKSKRVIGIELGLSEHEDAEKFKENNGLKGLLNMHGDCGEVLDRINEKFDCVVVDPPKAGMDKRVCQAINNCSTKKVIYISCDSATMIRDIIRMPNYKVIKASLFDMFACTGEYEALIVMEKK